MIDPLIAEALENLERDVSFLMALHEPSNNPSNLEERVAEIEKQLSELSPAKPKEAPKKERYTKYIS